jgi:hypothetical protein
MRMYFTVRTLLKNNVPKLNGDNQVHHSSGTAEFCCKPDESKTPSTTVYSLICEVQLHVKVYNILFASYSVVLCIAVTLVSHPGNLLFA